MSLNPVKIRFYSVGDEQKYKCVFVQKATGINIVRAAQRTEKGHIIQCLCNTALRELEM